MPFDFDGRLRFDAATVTKIKISSGTPEYGIWYMKKTPFWRTETGSEEGEERE